MNKNDLQNRFLNFTILKNDFISNKNYGWRDKLKNVVDF